jgi:hypothetical protein
MSELHIKEMRLSFIQVECLAEPLRRLQPPTIPFAFLLSGPLFEKQVQSLTDAGPCFVPWRGGYGKLFWQQYVHVDPPTSKDCWRALVPLNYELALPVTTLWPDGVGRVRSYLYPWGIGLVVDVTVTGSMELEAAVTQALSIWRSPKFHVDLPTVKRDSTLKDLIDLALNQIRTAVYGPGMGKGRTGELFSIATVVDADGGDENQAVPDGGDIHHALEGLTGWNPKFASLKLDPLTGSTLDIKKSPPGHVLYAGHRGRAAWFPGNFRSVPGTYPHTLVCYHQNLTMASLQTESLCRLAKDTAEAFANNQPLAVFSVAYRDCARLAAGRLGRLYGGIDTYRSNSIRDQIKRSYKDAVDSMRGQAEPPMPPLTP